MCFGMEEKTGDDKICTGGVKSCQGKIDDINNAMRWGSMCEDHAVATYMYINGMQCTKFEKNRTLGNN